MRVSREVPVGLIPHPNELDRKRIERALISRKHSPSVTPVKAGYLIESPCCSRNIVNDGGQIDVALFHYDAVSRDLETVLQESCARKLEILQHFPPACVGDRRIEHGSRAAVLAVMLIGNNHKESQWRSPQNN
ncbi:hypothetical protein ACVWZL_008984 [Bradyrhizobium sp. GM2.4]